MKRLLICEKVATTTWDQIPPSDIAYTVELVDGEVNTKVSIDYQSDGAPSLFVVGQTYHMEIVSDG